MKESYNYLLNYGFKDNDYVVVGVSGGIDSMTLLHLLISLRKQIKINIVCAHVNHNLRIESEEEKIFVENYCKDNNIIFEYMKITSLNKDNFNENEARKLRYDFFKSVITKYNSKTLLTAHHGDDLIETILMRMVRGSSLTGYAGFKKESDMITYKIIRPLIYSNKKEIIEYANKNNIKYMDDKTNNSDSYTRNRYRHNILPFLKEENPNVHEKFLKFSELLNEYSSYIDKIMLSNIDKIYKDNKLNINEYIKLDKLIKEKLINYIFETIYKENLSMVTDCHKELIVNLINNNKPNMSLILPNNIRVIKKYDYLLFEKECKEIENYNIILKNDITLPNSDNIIFLKEEISDSNYVCRLNSKDIKLPLYVRNRCDGDKISIKGLNGTKKIKDIFINEKLPLNERNEWPVVLDSNNNVIWLPGLKKSKYNKKINENYDIILKYDKKEDK